jgi:hypothetical protein
MPGKYFQSMKIKYHTGCLNTMDLFSQLSYIEDSLLLLGLIIGDTIIIVSLVVLYSPDDRSAKLDTQTNYEYDRKKKSKKIFFSIAALFFAFLNYDYITTQYNSGDLKKVGLFAAASSGIIIIYGIVYIVILKILRNKK